MGGWITLSVVLPMVVNQYHKTDRYNFKFWCYELCLFCLYVKYFIKISLFGRTIYTWLFNYHLIRNFYSF